MSLCFVLEVFCLFRVWECAGVGCEELGWVLLGEVCVMGICGESRDV